MIQNRLKAGITRQIENTPALPYTLALVAGLFLGRLLPFLSPWVILAEIIVILFFSFLLRDNKRWRPVPGLLSTLLIGVASMQMATDEVTSDIPEGKTDLSGVVVDVPKGTGHSTTFSLYVSSGLMEGRQVRVILKDDSLSASRDSDVRLGCTYRIHGYTHPFRNSDDSNFNYPLWAQSHSLSAQIYVYPGNLSQVDDELSSLPFLTRVGVKAKLIRDDILERLEQDGLTTNQYAIIAAMAFGDKSHIDSDTRDVYSLTGASHLLALSGMHLGIIFVLLTLLFVHGRRPLLGNVIVIVSIWAYVVLVGMPSSAVRSATMMTLYAMATVGGRSKMSVNVLCVTASVMLLCNPLMIWDVGFQMSFMAVMGILLFYAPIYNIVSQEWLFEHFALRKLWALVVISIAAQLATLPLSVYYFGRIPLGFLVTNIVAVPLVTILLYCVCLSVIFFLIPPVHSVFIFMARLCADILNVCLSTMSHWPAMSISDVHINLLQVVILYAGIFLLGMKKKRR